MRKLKHEHKEVGLLVGRILMGALFVVNGYSKLMGMEGVVAYMGGVGLPESLLLAWLVTLLELVGGVMLVLGIHPTVAALVLAIYLIPITLFFHVKLGDQQQMVQALKNAAIIGGLLTIFLSEPGMYKLLKSKD